MWVSLRNSSRARTEPGCRLEKDDVFKLGNCKFLVKELVVDEITPDRKKDSGSLVLSERCPTRSSIDNMERDSFSSSGNSMCRICLSNDSTDDNPLMESPCKCIGSIRLLHKNCLTNWLRSKMKTRITSLAYTCYWRRPKCDVCKEYYPDDIRCPNNTLLEVADIKRPKSNYIIIESIPVQNAQNKCTLPFTP